MYPPAAAETAPSGKMLPTQMTHSSVPAEAGGQELTGKHSSSRLWFISLTAQPSGTVLGKSILKLNNSTNNLLISLSLTCGETEHPVFVYTWFSPMFALAPITSSSGFVVVVYFVFCFQLTLCSNRKEKMDVQMLLLSHSQVGGKKHKTLQGQNFWSKCQVTNLSGPRTLHNGGEKLKLWRLQDLSSCLLCDSGKEVDTLWALVSLPARRQMSSIRFRGAGTDNFSS